MIIPIVMLKVLLGIGTGIFAGVEAEKTHSYCECYRSNFDGQYCQSIKGDERQGSCHK